MREREREKEVDNILLFYCIILWVANGRVWSGHNWVGYIKLIYPFETHLTNFF